ncbi:MAG: prolipoprotein diacylglyceryl transferase [Deltaproteobacteria bacterium]|nr:MAG: prolipoprotein diacylglyceryl transferase [Deltaproteobacteria bacterium]RKX57792.1 MAG: prolipoprotein diacylglyceryl transferase [Thermodesulfobacteriota bacterium]
MLAFPDIDPVIIRIGPLGIHWYGLMYLLGFGASYLLVRKQIIEECRNTLSVSRYEGSSVASQLSQLEGILFSLILGIILGARLGYVLFYNLSYYLEYPSEIFAVWHGGMSFHGGVAGVVFFGWIYCKRHDLDFWKWSDRFAVTAPVGLGMGRIGNFINGELFGRPADVPWAMVFPRGGPVPRHPSQLYEALLEGLLLFIILWTLRHRAWPYGRKLALFLVLYAVCRIAVEFFREPDPQLGYVFLNWVTMGQLLSLALLALGIIIWRARGGNVRV